jgi:hypothetical protein
MPDEESILAGTRSDRRCFIELKTWMEGARDLFIRAIQRTENELEWIRQAESEFTRTEALSPVIERLAEISAGMNDCLDILRDQDREWIKWIDSVENLGRISAPWGASGEVLDRSCLIELKAWLDGTPGTLIRAIKRAEDELERIRRIESAFPKAETLSPDLKRLTGIRTGMEECLDMLWDLNVECISRATWVENLVGKTSVARKASTESGRGKNRIEVRDEVLSKPLGSDFGVLPFPDEEKARVDMRNTITAILSKNFPEHTRLIFIYFVIAIVLTTASLIYLRTDRSNRLSEPVKPVTMLKKKLPTSHPGNKEQTLENADLNQHSGDSEARSSELKDTTNNASEPALKEAKSGLAKNRNHLVFRPSNSPVFYEPVDTLRKLRSSAF